MEDSQEKLLAALVIDGSINDESFNQGAWSGVGYKLEDETYRQAKLNPSTWFASLDVVKAQQDVENLLCVDFKVEQAAFLAGYIAAKMSKTGKIGFVGGIEGEIVGRFDYGYQAGALYADKDIEIINQYAQSFFDVSKGRGIAELMLQKGVDVIFHAAGPTGRGMIECVREKQIENEKKGLPGHVWAIGVDIDEYKLAPEVVLTSVVKRVDNAAYSILEEVKNKSFKGGCTLTLGLEGEYVGLSATTPVHVPSQLLIRTDKLKEEILKGNIDVPKDEQGLELFKEKAQESTF
ncbi:UNVERIFIED_CONTAM: hypothetical protein PYX00_010896 [Menopon gallinae]|uniref:ABC transporter substrate-binding protein PnrA-like domain-containing protein n=1 Tax=Menopon gallinae TaxID=328185 RepID=A0AAW2H6T1_9NEOP